jgi:hypothetical protein
MIKEILSKQKKVKCSDTKSHTVIRSLAIALKKPYIQANPLNSFEWIILDIDHENTFIDDLQVKPNIIVYNKTNNKAHYYFKIKAVHNNDQSSYKAIGYYQAVRYGLNTLLDGDRAFTQTLSKNPLAKEHFRVLEVHNKEYELSELAEYCELVPKYKIKAITDVSERAEILGRNQSIFDAVRVEAYKMDEPTEEQIRAITDSFNNNLANPLVNQEIKHIARSIAKYVSRPRTQRDKDKFIERQSQLGKKSGVVRAEKAQKRKDKAFVLFANPKYKLQEIADKLEVSLISIKKYKAEFKKVYLTNQVVPSLVGSPTFLQGNKAIPVDNYLSAPFSLYRESEYIAQLPINTINRFLE